MFRQFVIFAALASLAAAQSTSTISGPVATPTVDACIQNCFIAADGTGCASYTNTTCICTNKQYQASVATCLAANCTAADLQTVLGLQQAQCAAISSSLAHASSTATSTS